MPADDKHDARLIVSQIVLDSLADLKMAYPKTTTQRHQELKSFRNQLQPAGLSVQLPCDANRSWPKAQ